MILYTDSQFASPYAMSVFVALKTKSIPFDLRTVDLGADGQAAPAFVASSLTSRVPVLVDGDFALSESSAIVEYLDEKLPEPPLYPADVHSRAKARQVQAWLRSDLLALRSERTTAVVFYQPTNAALSSAGRANAEKLLRVSAQLLGHGGDNLFGEWCIADVDLSLMLNRLVLNGDSVPTALSEYARRQWRRSVVQEWVNLQRPAL